MNRVRNIVFGSRVMSMLFTPFYLPLLGLIVLFFLSYLNQLPLAYRLQVLIIVYFFTILLPTYLIHFYRKYQGWTLIELGRKERRMVPYVISILCYVTCVWLMELMHIPHFIGSIVVTALVIQMICAVINIWWKISTHTAGIGGVAGALLVFAEYFQFNPVWWLTLVIILAGVLGTARMILRQHTLPQVVVGFWVGLVCAVLTFILL